MLETIKAFLDMGGYGFYVWSAYAAVAIGLGTLWMSSRQKPNK